MSLARRSVTQRKSSANSTVGRPRSSVLQLVTCHLSLVTFLASWLVFQIVALSHQWRFVKGRAISRFAVVAATVLVFSTGKPSQAAASPATADAPVEFTFDGIAPDKAKITYKIKVNTDKPIKEVHMNLKEMDASGKALVENTLIWKNIVHSTEQPIEQGKTYEDYTMLNPGAVKAECSVAEVIFKDFTRWSATASARATSTPAPASKPPPTK